MEKETIIIKSEPTEDGYDTAIAVQGDQTTFNRNNYKSNGFGHEENWRENGVSDVGKDQEQDNIANTNFSCLLCDIICQNRDELRKHLKTDHKSKSNFFNQAPSHRGDFYSSYLQFRYTCNFCGAKFKTFKNYFSHSMSHKGYTSLHSSLNDAMLRSGKEVLQNYFDTEDGFPGSFRCEECKTVFMQRDSYAMHMMMRAMNETCRPDINSQTKMEINDDAVLPNNEGHYATQASSSGDTRPQENDVTDAVSNESQKCLEDVTCKVDQDEYLKSVLDKVVAQNGTHEVLSESKLTDARKPCIFCGQSFADQDSLAMHVMSIHADQMFSFKPNRHHMTPKPTENLKWMPPHLYPLDCKYCGKKFLSRDNLAMHVLTHTQEKSLDTSHDENMFSLKRKAEQVNNLTESHTSSKLVKCFGNASNYLFDKKTVSNNFLTASDLYCTICSIQFYSKGDYEWHVRCRHHPLQSGNEPLCLTKREKDDTSDNLHLNYVNTGDEKDKRARRNSFSIDEKSRHHYVTPKRPVSADTLVKSYADARTPLEKHNDTSKPSDSSEAKNKDLKIKKEIQRSMAIACVDALSSNEKRIIYSVFGNDLLKNNENNKESKQGKETVEKLDTGMQVVKRVPQEQVAQLSKRISRDSQISGTSALSSGDSKQDLQDVLKGKDAAMCRYCEIIFLNKAIYYLHMGLHNVNNQWQCNVCGKICKSAVDFAAHIIHM